MALGAVFLLNLFIHIHAAVGFLLSPSGPLHKLPQYETYGKSLVLIGGNEWDNNTEIYGTFVKLAGGVGVAKIGIINTANADPLNSFNFWHDLFKTYGVLEANRIPVDLNHSSNNAKQEIIDLIYNQTGFFFGGGDQIRILQSFRDVHDNDSPALTAIHQMFENGAVIGGTSAGCTCQTAHVMIEDGVSYEALRYGSFPYDDANAITDANQYVMAGGIGFLDRYVLDSHFSQRGREGRLIRFLSDTRNFPKGSNFGIGIDENTALVVTHSGKNQESGQVVGTGGVSIIDVSNSRLHKSSYFHISDVYVSYLTHGDVMRMYDRSITFSANKTSMRGHERNNDVITSDDIFYGSKSDDKKPEFVRVANSVFDARNSRKSSGNSSESHPKFHVDVSATGQNAEGWAERMHSFDTDLISYTNLLVEIYAI